MTRYMAAINESKQDPIICPYPKIAFENWIFDAVHTGKCIRKRPLEYPISLNGYDGEAIVQFDLLKKFTRFSNKDIFDNSAYNSQNDVYPSIIFCATTVYELCLYEHADEYKPLIVYIFICSLTQLQFMMFESKNLPRFLYIVNSYLMEYYFHMYCRKGGNNYN